MDSQKRERKRKIEREKKKKDKYASGGKKIEKGE